MKIESYTIESPISGLCKQSAIWGREGSVVYPLAYLQRPKWIEDDAAWKKIVDSLSCSLPANFEVR